MVKIKGVEDNFDSLTHIREILVGNGAYELSAADLDYAIPGIRVAELLGLGYYFKYPMKIFAPKREGQLNMADPSEGFVEEDLFSPGVLFNVKQAKYDKNYILTNIHFARRLFDEQGRVSALELRLKQGANFERVKSRMREIAGERFTVKDRFEQQDDTFKIMKIEKLMAYLFLTFILMVACFNIIGSLSMLIIDKKEDVKTLRNLGATDRQIKQLFRIEGWLISAVGAVVGVALGLLLCWLQQRYGLVGLGRSSGSFVVDAYPVSVHPTDILLVLVTVMAVGFVAACIPKKV